jgi:Cd2+/Zn2+-exporting ATPase
VTQEQDVQVLVVEGMDCPGCAATIEKAVARLPGVRQAAVDFGTGRLRVEHDPGALAAATLEQAVRRLGYRVATPRPQRAEPLLDTSRAEVRLVLLSGALVAVALLLGWLGLATASAVFWLGAALGGGWVPARRGLVALASGRVDMNCLMLLAASGAVALGDLPEAATVIWLFALGEMLEGFAGRRARRALALLLEERPHTAWVERQGEWVEVPAASVAVGQRVRVRPGERVPLDGVVVEGRSSVDQAPVTGESVPVDKAPGDEVFAGSLNQQGTLVVQAIRPYEQSTLSRVLDLVQEAQARKGQGQRLVDRFAARYTPAVVAGAGLLALAGPLVTDLGFREWAYRALVLLVIACPCALVISIPVSIVSALTGAARRGVLIKGGAEIERLAAARAVAFDKTGTLTRGALSVAAVVPAGRAEAEVLRLAAAAEAPSEHPLGMALVRHARSLGTDLPPAQDFQALPGCGVRARVEGHEVFVGRAAQVPPELAAMTVVQVEVDGALAGWVAFADHPRQEAAAALDRLRRLGLRRLVMLTGDRPEPAAAVAAALGIEEVHAGLLPEDKMRILAEMQKEGLEVAMVGDGINDAPALAAASVGLALGAAGSTVALETADVALMREDLLGVPLAFELARRCLRVVRQNVALSLGIKAVFLAAAVVGASNMWGAIAADMGASLLVTLNGLRLASSRD